MKRVEETYNTPMGGEDTRYGQGSERRDDMARMRLQRLPKCVNHLVVTLVKIGELVRKSHEHSCCLPLLFVQQKQGLNVYV